MKRLTFLILSILFAWTVQAGTLADKFNAFTKMEGVSVRQLSSQEAKEGLGAISGAIAMPKSDPSMMKFPFSFAKFYEGLPQSARLNSGKLAEGEPETFFIQPNASSNAEIIIIMYGDRITKIITFAILPPKEAKEFKESALKTLRK